MTPADNVAFEVIFVRVQKLYGKPKDGEMCRAYFDALKDLPLTVVDAAAHALIKTEKYFPRPVDWLDAAYKIQPQKIGFAVERWATTATGERVPTMVCWRCSDSGWRPECGCDLKELIGGRCPEHGPPDDPETVCVVIVSHGVRNGKVIMGKHPNRPARRWMPMRACACRETNPEWLSAHRGIHKFQEQR